MGTAEKKQADPHKDCPPPVWAGVDWQCTNHSPPQVVMILREAYKAPGRGPAATAPVSRPVRDKDLLVEVGALRVKLEALTDEVATLKLADKLRTDRDVAQIERAAAKGAKNG